jgi:feruloyl esterase
MPRGCLFEKASPARSASSGCLAIVLIAIAISVSPPASGAVTGGEPDRACQALVGDHADIEDAATRIMSAKLAPPQNGQPAVCEVEGYVSPAIKFDLKLPATGWNGKYLQAGCGAFCGAPLPWLCGDAPRRGYACLVHDTGHVSTMVDGIWADNNLQAKVDFAFRAVHVAALAGKAIAAQYYGSPPKLSYFYGSSTGGRQGLVEAERFPWDFNGIIAAVPPLSETGDGLTIAWGALALVDRDGRQIVTPDDIRVLHKAVLAACDKDDGVEDGIIGDPRTCRFDPGVLQCGPAKPSGCLTDIQVAAIRKIYAGPHNAKGEPLYNGRVMPGSELDWIGNYVSEDGGPSTYYRFMTELFRYMAFWPDPGPRFNLPMLDWEKDYRRLVMTEALYNALNPDLSAFRTAGGKMITYQGWGDQSVFPERMIEFYDTVTRTMGGPNATQAFYRLFMVPGRDHAGGNWTADAVDWLAVIEDWVENNHPPDRILAGHLKATASHLRMGAGGSNFSEDIAADSDFTRPLYPYPLQARYSGQGDANDAGNFKPQ